MPVLMSLRPAGPIFRRRPIVVTALVRANQTLSQGDALPFGKTGCAPSVLKRTIAVFDKLKQGVQELEWMIRRRSCKL